MKTESSKTSVFTHEGRIIVEFEKPIDWLRLDRRGAENLALKLMKRASKLKANGRDS